MMASCFSRIFAGFLLLSFFFNTNYVLMYYGVFSLNQKILAETVCEKKTEGCKGCCYLKKKIEQESKDDQSASELLKIKQKLSEFVICFAPFTEPKNTVFSLSSETSFQLSQGFTSLPGKPPQT